MSIFVSYSRLDETVVKALARGLEAADREVWFDNDLSGGEVWWVKILESIRQADVVMFGLSDHALRSKPCRAELDYAMALHRAILPIKVGPVANFRANPLSAVHTLEFRSDDAFTAFEIIGAVDDALRRTVPLPDPLPVEPQMPYAYLAQLSAQIDTELLSPQVQIDAVDELRKAYREETDETVHADIKEILQRLKSKPWATMQTAGEIDAVFDWIKGREQATGAGTAPGAGGARSGVRSAGSGTSGQPGGPSRTEVTEEDTRRQQFEKRLAGLMSVEQEKARVRREERKRAAAERAAAPRSGTSGEQPSSVPQQGAAPTQGEGQWRSTVAGSSGSGTGGSGTGGSGTGGSGSGGSGTSGSGTSGSGTGGTGTGARATDPPGRRPTGPGPNAGTTGRPSADSGAAPPPFRLANPSLRPGRPSSGPGGTGSPSAASGSGGWSAPTQAPTFSVAAPLGNSGQAGPSASTAPANAGQWTGVAAPSARAQPTGGSPPRPHWGWGIVALPTVLLGAVALYWAAQVNPRLSRGDVAGAQRASAYARGWGIAGLVVLGIVLVLALLRYI